jgi:hypothetical protein
VASGELLRHEVSEDLDVARRGAVRAVHLAQLIVAERLRKPGARA